MSEPTSQTESSQTLQTMLEQVVADDRSLANALSALIDAADESGAAPLETVAIGYKNAHLAAWAREGKNVAFEAGRLSMDEIRAHLANSLLLRLADHGGLTLPAGSLQAPDTPIRIAPGLWKAIAGQQRTALDILQGLGGHSLAAGGATPAASAVSAPFGKVLSVTHLSKVYRGRRVVDDVALQVQQGEIVGLLGPNGAGKTTTFYMLVGLIEPLEGRIVLDGTDITDMPMYKRARKGIGYLSQEPSVFRKLSVEDNILAILETLPISSTERAERLESLLGELGIKHLRASKAYQLSGGERRRLEITRALVTQPLFMMLDEPFAGVDPIAVHDIQEIVSRLRTRGIGVLISDHNVEQTLDIVDRAYIMFNGKVQVSGSVRDLVYDDTVSLRYLGPTLTARLRSRFSEAEEEVATT